MPGGVTRDASVAHLLDAPAATGAGDTSDSGEDSAAAQTPRAVREDTCDAVAARPKRRRAQVGTYDETTRRAVRQRTRLGYMDNGRGGGHKRTAIVVGPATMERTVRGRYEWRDSELAAQRGPRQQLWQWRQ